MGHVDEALRLLDRLDDSQRDLVLRQWAGLVGRTPDGLFVTARSLKELRRFTRRHHRSVRRWFGTFAQGDVFYDVGANCGGMALSVAAMHGGHVAVVAVEPSFASFESLVRNVCANDLLDVVLPLQVALLDETGIQPLYYQSTQAGTALHAVGQPVDHEGRRFRPVAAQLVPTFRLDELIAVLNLQMPTRMKIDVDGYEAQVLAGAAETLSAGTLHEILVEVVDADRAGTRPRAVQALLRRYGYRRVATVRHPGDASFVSDYLFRHTNRS